MVLCYGSSSLVLLGLCRCQAPNSRWAPLIACGMLSTTPRCIFREPGGLRRHMDYGHQWDGLGGSVRMGSAPEQRTAGGRFLLLAWAAYGS